MERPKIALYWCSSCGGCEESVIDLAEDILTIAASADIVFWPIAMDFKFSDVRKMKDGEISATLINGSIRMDEQEHMARLLRRKSRVLIAQGSCAHLGGVYGLANFCDPEEVLRRSYEEAPSVKNPQGILPKWKTLESGRELKLSGLHDSVKALDQVVPVDYYIPGCPPTPELIKQAITMILENSLPSKGSVVAEKKALCDTCPRKDSVPDTLHISEFKRLYEAEWDPVQCFLGQGIICLGPSTRGGCRARCINANMPCRGCFGPTENVRDHGAKSLSFLASLIDSKEGQELERIVDSIPDPAGLFYRFSLPSSMLQRKRRQKR
ncbi:MAG: oxidoreductase [Deltaproteobacteria bacterium]|nr:MAG: oxidoreductase [Deltaproteobacteria bacterium]